MAHKKLTSKGAWIELVMGQFGHGCDPYALVKSDKHSKPTQAKLKLDFLFLKVVSSGAIVRHHKIFQVQNARAIILDLGRMFNRT